MTEQVLLVEPDYYTRFPPLGLLKLSTMEKNLGNNTELVRKARSPKKRPDRIYITSLFTWAWKPVWNAIRKFKSWYPDVDIWLGGLYASLLPDHATLAGANHLHEGLFFEAEGLIPDYSLVPEWDGSIIFASRGCKNKCPYCVVPRLEGGICLEQQSIRELIYDKHKRIFFFDNNILAMKYWKEIFIEILELNMEVDFNQGLDASLITDESAKMISQMKIPLLRLAYDRPEQKKSVSNAINVLAKHGISKRRILVYALFNFNESPDEFLRRVLDIFEFGAVCYPMRFQPVNTLKKDKYVSPKWTSKQLNMVAAARRVIGYGGTFPPYEGLVNKFKKSNNFDEAFKLYPLKKNDESATQIDDFLST